MPHYDNPGPRGRTRISVQMGDGDEEDMGGHQARAKGVTRILDELCELAEQARQAHLDEERAEGTDAETGADPYGHGGGDEDMGEMDHMYRSMGR